MMSSSGNTKRPDNFEYKIKVEIIRAFLMDFANEESIPLELVIERFLGNYYAFEKLRQSLIYTLEDMNRSFEAVKKSYELRGRKGEKRLAHESKQLEELTMALECNIHILWRYCALVIEIIFLLPDAEMRTVLELHYVEGLTLAEIRESDRLCYGRTKMNGLHREGLKQLHQILEL